ncbi:glycosyltransferase [Arachidicoccus soli]|uniref:Glycosyltransferase n=1 Tax=Arachidicoccus soli TaxID=2341117 RepID=A0A386HQL9_9BACT|nr:glycosyltransferase [Arachidicoccus soli]AYD47982.1 glycosyltransferase [Arachidicoccus soli]
MKALLQINTVVNTGSTGRIAEDIGNMAMENGWKSYIAYGRYGNSSNSNVIKIGSKLDNYIHVLFTRLFDKHGFASKRATRKFIRQIEKIKPDIIHLHNIHGYYLNIKILFDYLASVSIPIVWTLHDCWAYTGHCTHYTYSNCQKWRTHCNSCPEIHSYPKSLRDNSYKNFDLKRILFNSISNLTLVSVSKWLEKDVKQSFLMKNHICQIYNGVDLQQFKPVPSKHILSKLGIENKFVILGVASTWSNRKGLCDFMDLSKLLQPDEVILLVGLSNSQMKNLPIGIIGISRTENIEELVELYNAAAVFVNPTWEDNFPTTNLEALACGTPVITYATGGSIEAIDKDTGWIVEPGDIKGIYDIIFRLKEKHWDKYTYDCRERALKYFNKHDRFAEYFNMYSSLLNVHGNK